MTKDKAYREAKKRWGNNAVIRMGPAMSSPEQRQAASEQLAAIRAEQAQLNQEIKDGLAALDWYQQKMARCAQLRKEADANTGKALYRRFGVGSGSGMFNTIYGSGDTFEEAFAEADRRRAEAA